MANVDKIRFPKPSPKRTIKVGYFLIGLSALYGVVTHFLTYEHFAIAWGPFLAAPFLILGLFLALQRRAQILYPSQKELVHTKELIGGIAWKKKPQSLSDFSRLRMSEDEIGGEIQYRIYLEGKVAPVLLTIYDDKNEATQRLKALAKLVDIHISWPQVQPKS